jgi:hypothetical protein
MNGVFLKPHHRGLPVTISTLPPTIFYLSLSLFCCSLVRLGDLFLSASAMGLFMPPRASDHPSFHRVELEITNIQMVRRATCKLHDKEKRAQDPKKKATAVK